MNVPDTIIYFVLPLLGLIGSGLLTYVAFVLSDTRVTTRDTLDQVRKINGRLLRLEEWRDNKEVKDTERHIENRNILNAEREELHDLRNRVTAIALRVGLGMTRKWLDKEEE